MHIAGVGGGGGGQAWGNGTGPPPPPPPPPIKSQQWMDLIANAKPCPHCMPYPHIALCSHTCRQTNGKFKSYKTHAVLRSLVLHTSSVLKDRNTLLIMHVELTPYYGQPLL